MAIRTKEEGINWLQVIQLAVTLVLLVVGAISYYERGESVTSSDIAVIKNNLDYIRESVGDIKATIEKKSVADEVQRRDFEKRLTILEQKTDNTRTTALYSMN